MKTRSEFARALACRGLSLTEVAIAFLWYYRQTEQFGDRTPSELAEDLNEEGFPRPNVTRLRQDLTRSRYTTGGRRAKSFQLDVRGLSDLDDLYADVFQLRKVQVEDTVLPADLVVGTRAYLERLVDQINGAYQFGFYDACAVVCRRLMESLIIEVYVSKNRHHEIRDGGLFWGLERLIAYIKKDTSIVLSRGSGKGMDQVKQLGDTAAHDRVYITSQMDIDELKGAYRRLITQLLGQAGLLK